MRLHKITDPHKATVKRHLDESLAKGVPLDQIHQELQEVFRWKGRYTLRQITAQTSWQHSQALRGKRVADLPTSEFEEGETTSEDIDFDNPQKRESRDWFMRNFARHLAEDTRAKIRFLLLPGQNTHDLDAVISNLRIPAHNLLTYIRGDVPRANAQYIRNARDYGVIDRRIGDMTKLLPEETVVINAAYLDFFGQYCPAFDQILKTLPIPPNTESIPIGINLREGREHDETVGAIQAMAHLRNNMFQLFMDSTSDSDFHRNQMQLLHEGQDERPEVLKDARDRALGTMLFSSVGIAQPKHWILYESIRNFVQCNGEHEGFDHLDPLEKFRIFRKMAMSSTALFADSVNDAHRAGIELDMNELGNCVCIAAVNSPLVRAIEKPNRYISPNGNTPFISFFGVLETIREQYLKHSEAIQFYLDVATQEFPIAMQAIASHQRPRLGSFSVQGSRTNQVLIYRSTRNVTRGIALKKLQDACVEIGSLFALGKNQVAVEDEEVAALQSIVQLKAVKSMVDSGTGIIKSIEVTDDAIVIHVGGSSNQQVAPYRNLDQRIGRNDPCPCGSGQKYKKCCLKNH